MAYVPAYTSKGYNVTSGDMQIWNTFPAGKYGGEGGGGVAEIMMIKL